MLAEFAGAALILGATSYAGWQVGARFARRPKELRDLQTGLAVLQTEIEYGATPLPAALAGAALAAGTRIGPLFAEAASRLLAGGGITAGEALQQALSKLTDDTALAKSDVDVLVALANVLGSSGTADQVRHLQLARERLTGEEARAQADRERYERMARYVGVLCGVAIVLILL